jgi:hypothetical protein
MSYALAMSGTVGTDPATTSESAALIAAINLNFQQTYDNVLPGGLTLTSAEFPISLGAMTAVRAIAIRAVDGQSLVVKVSSAAGANQLLAVSDLLVIRAQNTADKYTAISITGAGRVEWIIAGNNT